MKYIIILLTIGLFSCEITPEYKYTLLVHYKDNSSDTIYYIKNYCSASIDYSSLWLGSDVIAHDVKAVEILDKQKIKE